MASVINRGTTYAKLHPPKKETKVPDSPELEAYKKKVLEVAESYYKQAHLCEDEFNKIVKTLELKLPTDEPEPGSLVVVNRYSVAYIRNMAGSWWAADGQEGKQYLTWSEVKERIGDRQWGLIGATKTGWKVVDRIKWNSGR